uniref:NADH dehydrogenase subunit 6 n=1 Tax=Montfortula punctata TaxID=1906930 RepID=A0A1J0CYG8_9VEST|nr:NADH dehydrogenase subunit 6 [Montfortula punctata]
MLPMLSAPLSLGLIVIMLSGVMCLLIGLTPSSWYGYILFLIYIGGLLVMFIYVSAITPNVVFTSSIGISVSVVILWVSVSCYLLLFSNMSGMLGEIFGFVESGRIYGLFGGDVLAGPKVVVLLVILGVVLLMNLVAAVVVCVSRGGGALRRHES